ncbi:NPCBM/NEW2 domain-containing protein [Deinococcus apachensis]|uniref:NPCBM/NEW2 domain-containing protein n=1 Tax=Deinococcus apachensis TaxID=309886 RepID=UPI00037EC86A|nr:NPCBM/NEW2 domain-containing protein [Deinococcus apachensis]
MAPSPTRRWLYSGALALVLAACNQQNPDPYANGAQYPWTYTPSSGQLAPQRLTPTENNLHFETILDAKNGWGPIEVNRSNGERNKGDGHPLTLNGQTYPRGFGTHAGSDMHFSLQGYNDASCTRFTSDIGVDDEVGDRGSVVFQVLLDGVKVYDSGTMTGSSATQRVDLDLTGKQDLRLVVTDAGDGIAYDHADWALPKVFCQSRGRQLNYDFHFDPNTITAPNGTTATATLVVEDLGVGSKSPRPPSGPIAFQLKVFMTGSAGDIQLADPNRMYTATTFPAQFLVPIKLNTTCPNCSPQQLQFIPILEDYRDSNFATAHVIDLSWNVTPPPPPPTALTVTGVPQANRLVPITAPVQVNFNQIVVPTPETFLVNGFMTGARPGQLISTSQVLFQPDGGWKPGEQVEVTLRSGLRSLSSTTLNQPYVFRFQAGAGALSAGRFPISQPFPQLPNDGVGGGHDSAVGDVTGDGYLDLVATVPGRPTLSLLAGTSFYGVFLFKAAEGLSLPGPAESVTLGDVNRDGHLDIIASGLTLPYFSSFISTLLSNGDGTFQPATTLFLTPDPLEPLRREPYNLALGDMNGDGQLDLIAVTDESKKISVLLGKGDGRFEFLRAFKMSRPAGSIVFGDVNNDGRLDVVTTGIDVLLGEGSGYLTLNKTLALDASGSIRLGDLNGDGKLDLVSAYEKTLSIRLGNGDGTFQPAVQYAMGGSARGGSDDVALGDVNGDGNLDIAVNVILYGRPNRGGPAVFLGHGDGRVTAGDITDLVGGFNRLWMGDMNRDGKLDLVLDETLGQLVRENYTFIPHTVVFFNQ